MRASSKFIVSRDVTFKRRKASKNTLRCRGCGHKGNTCNNDDDDVNSI